MWDRLHDSIYIRPSFYIRLQIFLCLAISFLKWLHHSNATYLIEIQPLAPIVDFRTYFHNNWNRHASLLNLFFTTSPISCCSSQLCPLSNSDHTVVTVDIYFCLSIRQEPPVNRASFCYQILLGTHYMIFFDPRMKVLIFLLKIVQLNFNSWVNAEIPSKTAIFLLVYSCLFSFCNPQESILLAILMWYFHL